MARTVAWYTRSRSRTRNEPTIHSAVACAGQRPPRSGEQLHGGAKPYKAREKAADSFIRADIRPLIWLQSKGHSSRRVRKKRKVQNETATSATRPRQNRV